MDHLISALQAKYDVTQDWAEGLYCKITLKLDYKARQLDITMPSYVKYALHKFQHPSPTRPHHSPHQWISSNYGSTAPQLVHPTDDYPELNPYKSRNSQQVVGIFLYPSHAVDAILLVTMNTISAEQSKITQEKAKKVMQFLNYVVTHPEAITCYHSSGINLHMPSDASFFSATGYKSRSGGYHYLSEP